MGRTTVLAAAVLAAALAAPAAAQVNIEKMRGGAGERGLSVTASADLSVRSGNTDLTELTGEIRADAAGERAHGFVLGRGSVGWKDGERFSDSGLLHARAARPVRPRWELETFAQIDYDKARKLDFRAIAGAGPRFVIASGETFSLAVGTAWLREHEEYGLDAGARHPRDLDVSRWSNYLNLGARADRVSAGWILYAQPRFDRFDDARLLTEADLTVAVSGRVDLRNVLRVRWDSEPPDGIEDTDLRLVTGVAVRF